MAIGMLVLYLAITFIRNTIEPKLVGAQIGLHPLATLIAMYLGLRFLGFLGMFLFPVSLAVFVSIKHGQEEKPEEKPEKKEDE
jgi:predicted PurR-regulated permease PerM